MERFIRSLSIRKKDCPKNVEIGDSNKPQSWLEDQKRVRDSSCSYPVEYLGYIEVFESRGIVVCEKAVKALKSSKSKCKKAILYISGDAIRVIDDANKILLVDQTLEKVSFCAPDRNIYEGFAYICRDATSKRWLCHGFLATKDSGERISHALGCAFAVCLERKQVREKQRTLYSASSSYTPVPSSLADINKNGDSPFGPSRPFFRQASLLERLNDPQITMVTEPVPSKPAVRNEYEIKRPRPSSEFYKRQQSLQLYNTENIKRSDLASSNNNEDGDVFTIYEENFIRNNSIFTGISIPVVSSNNKINNDSVDGPNGVGGDIPLAYHRQSSMRPHMLSEALKRQMEFVISSDNQNNSFDNAAVLSSNCDAFATSLTSAAAATTISDNHFMNDNYSNNLDNYSNNLDNGNTNRKLSDAESWLNSIADSLANGNSAAYNSDKIPSIPVENDLLLNKERNNFLSVSNPFAFNSRDSRKLRFSAPEGSLVNDGYNPFL